MHTSLPEPIQRRDLYNETQRSETLYKNITGEIITVSSTELRISSCIEDYKKKTVTNLQKN